MESSSFDLSAYRFAQPTVSGLTPDHSFDNKPHPTTPLSYSYGTVPSGSLQQQQQYRHSPNTTVIPSGNQKQTKIVPIAGPQVLTWRLDPDESLSDWTLTVVSNPSLDQKDDDNKEEEPDEDRNQETTVRSIPSSYFKTPLVIHPTKKYFVHRTQLAVGPRRSEYFAKLFRNKQPKGSKANGTRIEVRPAAATSFPAMLDFIYSPLGSPAQVTTESAVALRHLATCFGIRELFDFVTEFIKKDLCYETSPTYLMEAQNFRHQKLFDVSLTLCAENFELIKFSKIVTLSAELFVMVVDTEELKCSSEVLSSRVASYCRCRPGAIDVDMLKKITNRKKMPLIAPEESLFFLHLLSEIDGDDVSVSTSDPSRTQDLYKRCVIASTEVVRMATESKETAPSKKSSESRPKRNAVKEYHSLPAAVKVDLLEQALAGSPTIGDMMELDHARKDAKKKQVNKATRKLQEMEAEMERIQRAYEKKLSSLQATVEAQEQEIHAYATELSKFSRVPNAHRMTPLLSEYTYQGRPQFDEFGNSIYGEIPPSALPKFGRQTVDGWVLREDRWMKNGRQAHALWPMFFYRGDA